MSESVTHDGKRLRGYRATVAVAMSNYIEAGSIVALATSLTLWQERFGFSDYMVGLVAALSANAFGSAAGAMIGGPLGDRYGRKFIYTYDLVLYMIGTLVVVCATGTAMLVTGVVLTGIAVGAGVPVAWTYIAEEAPATARARHVGTAQLAWSLGPLVVYVVATALVPLGLLGSRIVFAHLFVVAFVTWWVRRGLAESRVWTENDAQLRASGTRRAGLRELLSLGVNVRAILFLLGVYALWGLAAGQMGIFMPRVYATAGVSSAVEQNLLQVLVWGLTVASTWWLFMRYADRVSRRLLYAAGAVLGIVAWLLLVFATVTTPVLLVFAVLWGISAGLGAQAFYAVWSAEMFPTVYRASAQGVMFFGVRVSCGVLSFVFPTLLATRGVPFVGVIMIAVLVLSLLVGTLWAPDTSGRTLEEIEAMRYGTGPAARPEGVAARR